MQISVTMKPDADGYTGRECPSCEKYFKIKFGTGFLSATDCHCPYCNHESPQSEFWTKQQIEYAQSMAVNQLSKHLIGQLKRLERRPNPQAFISIGIKVKGNPTPIAYYSEKELEERVACSSCSLEYSIYGTFAFCPDCGVHNSLQILNSNLDLILKTLDLAKTAEPQISNKLIGNALEDSVSCFDGFGREQCSERYPKTSFQGIESARIKLQAEGGVDIAAGLKSEEWKFVCEQFQKRHLLAHRMGIIDADFVAKTGCSSSMLGRKVAISDLDVRQLVTHLITVANVLFRDVPRG